MNNLLYSIILELRATRSATLPATTGHQAHALFLSLIGQIDAGLATRLHDEPDYRPFTVSPLGGAIKRGNSLALQEGQSYRLRVTLLDGGQLWQCLSSYFLGAGMQQRVRLGEAEFTPQKILSTAATDPTGWAANTDWQTLAHTAAQQVITMHFASPTAFSLGEHRFALFPEPMLLWDSLMRTWNRYAPEVLHLDKPAIREYVQQQVVISDYRLNTDMLNFPKYLQKGFVGSCTYTLKGRGSYAPQLATLAHFAHYAGVGYKTTMGMGQARLELRSSEGSV